MDRKKSQKIVGWDANRFFPEGIGCRCHTTDCPQCAAKSIVLWSLAVHPFPWLGIAQACSCPQRSYDALHKIVAERVKLAHGIPVRQDAIYALATGTPRAHYRLDPGKTIRWGPPYGDAHPVRGRRPLKWGGKIGQPILLVEGEKAAAAAMSAGLDGRYQVYSAGDTGGMYTCDYSDLSADEIVIWPDADPSNAGQNAAVAAAVEICRKNPLSRIRLPIMREMPMKADAADFPADKIWKIVENSREIRL